MVTRYTSNTNLTSIRSEWMILVRMGLPILIAQIAQMANGVIDTVMSGRASANDLTGVAIGNSLWVPVFLFVIGVLNAQQPMISGFKGGRQFDRIMPVAWHGIYFALFASLVVIYAFNQTQPLLVLIKLDAESARIAFGYLRAFSLGIPAILLIFSLRGLTDGLGHTRIIMSFTLLSTLINVPLNYVLIFGKLGFPELGGIGCGWATAVANWIALIALWVYLHRAETFKQFHFWSARTLPNRDLMRKFLRLGIPIGFTIFVEATMFSAIALLIAPLGAEIVAGHQIALNIVSVLFMVPLSLGLALMLRISFLIGAKQPGQVKLVARSSLLLVSVVALSFAIFLLLTRSFLAGLYTADQAVLAVAAHLLLFGAIFQITDVVQVVTINALRGFKDTRVPMYIMLFSFWGIGVPLGYILTFTDLIAPALGAAGFWIGMIVGLSHAAFWLVLRLLRMTA